MSDREMLSAQVSKDSALWEDFSEYKERNGFESRSEAMRAALRQGIEADERDDTAAVEDLRDELRELRDRQRTPLEEGGYLFASVVAGTSPIAMLYLTGLVSTPLAFVGGLAVALAGLLAGAVTKIAADYRFRADGGTVGMSGVSENDA